MPERDALRVSPNYTRKIRAQRARDAGAEHIGLNEFGKVPLSRRFIVVVDWDMVQSQNVVTTGILGPKGGPTQVDPVWQSDAVARHRAHWKRSSSSSQ